MCAGILVGLIGVRIGRRLVLGGMGMFLLFFFGIRLFGIVVGRLCFCRVGCRLLLLFLLLLGL